MGIGVVPAGFGFYPFLSPAREVGGVLWGGFGEGGGRGSEGVLEILSGGEDRDAADGERGGDAERCFVHLGDCEKG